MQRRSFARSSTFAAAACVCASVCAAHEVWVVGPQVGTDFTTVQAAISAASSGDIVLVRAGSYTGNIALTGKALTIVADAVVKPTLGVVGIVPITGIPAGAGVTLRGFHMPGAGANPFNLDSGTVALSANAGSVWIEDCRVDGSVSAIKSSSTAWLGVSRSQLTGFTGSSGAASSGTGYGLACQASTVTLHQSVISGGDGIFITFFGAPFATSGYAATSLASSTLLASRCQLTGGRGSGSIFFTPLSTCSYGNPGPGLLLELGSAAAQLLDTTVASGVPGPLNAPCLLPASVPPIIGETGAVATHAGAAPLLDSTAVTREGGTLSVTLETTSGQFSALLVATSAEPLYLGEYLGVLVNPAAQVFALGLVGPTGSVTTSAVVQVLGSGIEGVVLYLQGASCDLTTLACRLSNTSVATLVDSGI